MTNFLVDFWKAQNDKAEVTKLEESALELQIQAEGELFNMYKEIKTSETDLRKSKVDSQNKPDFSTIARLALKVKMATKSFTEALETFKDLFGEEPKYEFNLTPVVVPA
jgi:hypothetical protein